MTSAPAPSAHGFGHKAVAFSVLLGASALFLAMVVWPVAAPFMTLEFEPARSSADSTMDGALGDLLDRVR